MKIHFTDARVFALLLLVSTVCYGTAPVVTQRAIVIGASSGMGRQVAKLLATEGGYEVGLVGRRVHLLESLQQEIPSKTYIKQIDIAQHERAPQLLRELIDEMGGLDLLLIAASSLFEIMSGVDGTQCERDARIIAVDVCGFWAVADVAVEIFEQQRSGHLVGISSLSGVRGEASCPVYSAAKAFISRYLEGVRNHMIQNKISVYVTDIVPGFVDTERISFSQLPGTYWVTPLETAGRQIFEAIQKKHKVAYISARQILIKWALDLVPDCIYNAMGGF